MKKKLTNPQKILSDLLKISGPIPVIKVSSAKAKGRAKQYSYWGIAEYEICNRKKDGIPIAKAVCAAPSQFRSKIKAYRIAEEKSKETKKLLINYSGELCREDIIEVIIDSYTDKIMDLLKIEEDYSSI